MKNVIGTITAEGLGVEFGGDMKCYGGMLNAKQITFTPFEVSEDVTVYKLAFSVVHTDGTTTHVDVGIYDSSGNLISSSGSTVLNTTYGTQIVPIPRAKLCVGTYYLAFVLDTVIGPIWSVGLGSYEDATLYGIKIQNDTFPLPIVATLTNPIGSSSMNVPVLAASLTPTAL